MQTGPEILTPQEIISKAIYFTQREDELVGLIRSCNTRGCTGGVVMPGVCIEKTRIRLMMVVSQDLFEAEGLGNGGLTFLHCETGPRVDFPEMCVNTADRLEIMLHLDTPTQGEISELLNKDPDIINRLFTIFYFDSSGRMLKVSSLPKDTRDSRVDFGKGRCTSKFVESVINNRDLELVGTAFSRMERVLRGN